jgi:hypothetical protein
MAVFQIVSIGHFQESSDHDFADAPVPSGAGRPDGHQVQHEHVKPKPSCLFTAEVGHLISFTADFGLFIHEVFTKKRKEVTIPENHLVDEGFFNRIVAFFIYLLNRFVHESSNTQKYICN